MAYQCDGPMHDGDPVEATLSVMAFESADTKFLCPMCFAIMGYQVGIEAKLWPDGLLQALEAATADEDAAEASPPAELEPEPEPAAVEPEPLGEPAEPVDVDAPPY